MTRVNRQGVGLALIAAAGGCMLAPGNGSSVQQITDPVSFSGVLPGPGGEITLEASTNAGGPFSSWRGASTTASATGTPWGSYTLYDWQLSSVIPADRWGDVSVIPGCPVKRTFVRSRTGQFLLATFDEPAGASALACLASHGDDLTAAVTNCRSASSPVVSIRSKNVHQGDATITSLPDVMALRCVQIINGSLTIPDSSLMAVSLPLLERVTGNVTLFVKTELAPVAGPVFTVRSFTLPGLQQIGGSLAFEQNDIPATSPGWVFDLGLGGLTQLGGSLSIHFGIHGVSPKGMPALTSIPGDLDVSFVPFTDVQANLLLANLHTVGGNVSLSGGYTVLSALTGLQQIGGNLQVQNACTGSACGILPALQNVSGAVTLDGMGGGSPLFGMLAAASGGLALHAMNTRTIGTTGTHSVQLGALTILDSPGWTSLGTNWRLAPAAPVTLHDTGLSTAAICAFLAGQPDYTGTPPPDLGGASCP